MMYSNIARQWNAARSRLSLSAQIAAMTAVMCVTLVLAAALIAGQAAKAQSEAVAVRSLASIANQFAERLEYRMYERYREIRNLEALSPLRTVWTSNPAQITEILEHLQATLNDYAWIGFASPTGNVLASTGDLLVGASVAERPWFTEGLKGPFVGDVHDAKLLAGLLRPSISGEPLRFVDIAVPVHDQTGKLVGVLGAHLSWDWAAETRQSLLDLLSTGSVDAWILRSNGEVILGPETGTTPFTAAAIFSVQQAKQHSFVSVDGSELVSLTLTEAYADYPGLGWIVAIKTPVSVAMASANSIFTYILAFGVVLAVGGATGFAWIMARMMRPLRRLASQIDDVGRGGVESGIRRSDGCKELVLLSTSIRSLLRRTGAAEEAEASVKREAAQSVSRLEEKNRRLGEDMTTLRALADTDPLTGLLNRRAFNAFAEDAFHHFRRYKRPLAVLVVDIDFFKRVNDDYGHATGDDVIQSIGSTIAASIRTTDKVARFGGEEFVVMLREIDPPTALTLAERMRESIAASFIDTPGHGPIYVTVSIGVAFVVGDDRDFGDVVERADRALYRAKAAGRNQVSIEWPDNRGHKAA